MLKNRIRLKMFLDSNTLFLLVTCLISLTSSLIQPGKNLLTFEKETQNSIQQVFAPLYKDTDIVVLVDCEGGHSSANFSISVKICFDPCQANNCTYLTGYNSYATKEYSKRCSSKVLLEADTIPLVPHVEEEVKTERDAKPKEEETDVNKDAESSGSGSGEYEQQKPMNGRKRRNDPLTKITKAAPVKAKPTEAAKKKGAIPRRSNTGESTIARTSNLGYYTIQVQVMKGDQEIKVTVETRRDGSYLSARDWPFLPFYGTMSLIYLFFAFVWLILCCRNWKDLLRIQFWIGGVIAIGMLENALFYTEYTNINHTGKENDLFFFAEFVSCVKRALARILVIIISMGFGIVKPRLGENLPKVLAVGGIYILSALVEGVLRVKYGNPAMTDEENAKKVFYAVIPLTVIDVGLCYWVFKALVETTRTLRIRKNVVKLNLYRHFTNTLIFMVVASLAYMVWMIKEANTESKCPLLATVWLNDALWPFLFAIILSVIIFLWRPSKNSRRYENFTPLMEGDEEDDTMTVSDAFGNMKLRGIPSVKEANGSAKSKAEDDLKWVEENIPNLPTTLLPEIDSDEEVMTTKFEQSKMD